MNGQISQIETRIALVNEHIRCENEHDLDAVLATFGIEGRYDDEPWDDHRVGLDGVRSYYTELISALPDLSIEVIQRHVAEKSIIVEVIIRGTHLGAWRGLPATGRKIDRVPPVRHLHIRPGRKARGRTHLLRPRFSASPTRSVPRTDPRLRPHIDRTKSSNNYRPGLSTPP